MEFRFTTMNVRHFIIWTYILFQVALVSSQPNRPPSVVPGQSYFEVLENATIGTVIYHLEAQDTDTGDSLTFSTDSTDTGNLVSIGSAVSSGPSRWSAPVTLLAALDRDNSPASRPLYFKIRDSGGIEVQARIIMIINDVNDNPPSFVNLPYKTSIPEDTAVGTNVFNVSATDPDSNLGGSVRYTLIAASAADGADYDQTFKVNPGLGTINLTKSLDYEDRYFYHFKVEAKDEGNPQCPGNNCMCIGDNATCNPEPVDLFITIEDVQDTPPVFEKLPYIVSVLEDQTVGSSILTVTAVDGDRGAAVPNDVHFSLTGGDHSLFHIDERNGTITVAQVLDFDTEEVRNKGGLYVFTVTATEVDPTTGAIDSSNVNHNTTTQVSITVTDVNDNIPQFSSAIYNATVLENTASGAPLTFKSTIIVEDIDQGVNSTFQVSLEKDGAPYSDFETFPGPGQIILGKSSITINVVNSSALDYETTKTITFQLIAKENVTGGVPRSSNATVIVQILDTNDNNPEFPSQQTKFNESEDAFLGTVVGNISACDVDTHDAGVVTFSFEDNGGDSAFNISETGQIIVASELDREKRSSYSLVVVATDSPSAPEAERRRSRLPIVITVNDVNDNYPVWTQAFPTVSVLESAGVGTKVTDLLATDLDEGPNGEIEYSIAPGTNGSDLFNVSNYNGRAELKINSSLIDNYGLRLVQVIATDKGVPPKNSVWNISVMVIDENQNRPVFIHPDETGVNVSATIYPEIEVEEEVPVGTVLYTLSATDKDENSNGLVYYYLVPSTNPDYEYFRVDRVSGNLSSVRRLDAENEKKVTPVYEIQVKAEDNGQPAPLSTTLTMRVKLRDIDDNEPSYRDTDMPQVLHVIEENDTAIIGLLDKPKDADLNASSSALCYYIYGGSFITNLHVDEKTGILKLKKKVDRETTPSFDVVIKATQNCSLNITAVISANDSSSDDAPPSFNSSDYSLLWVRVAVDDINDNPPIFDTKDLSEGLLYDADVGTEVMSLRGSVTDKDTPNNSLNSFTLLSQKPVLEIGESLDTSKPAFLLSSNGSITTNIRFQADLLGYFQLTVMVKDPDGQNDTATVKVFLISNMQRVKLVFNRRPNEVESLKNEFIKKLSDILNVDIVFDKIQSHTNPDGTRDPTKTDAYIHGRYRSNGEIIPASDLWRMFDFNQAAKELMVQNGVQEAQILQEEKADDGSADLKRIFAIVCAVLGVIVIALVVVLCHMIRLYRRRLRAATTMAYASTKEKEMYEHPGTNKYFAAENPLFGKEIKQTVLDDDRTSQNSLDENAVDPPTAPSGPSRAEPDEEQEMVLHIIEGAEDTPHHGKDINHNANLDQVLQAYQNRAYKDDDEDSESNRDPYTNVLNTGTRNGHLRSASSSHNQGFFIPGLGQDVQEGVTRFSDEIMSSDSGFPDGNGSARHSHIEYTEI